MPVQVRESQKLGFSMYYKHKTHLEFTHRRRFYIYMQLCK